MSGFRTQRTIARGRELEKQKEIGAIEKAGSKQSLWSTVGGSLGSLALLALMGTTGPLGVGLVSGLGSLGGSLLGQAGAKATGGDIKGGRWTAGEARDVRNKMITDAVSSAIIGGVTAGTGEALKGAKIAKEAGDTAVDTIKATDKFQNMSEADKLKKLAEVRQQYKYNPLKPGQTGVRYDEAGNVIGKIEVGDVVDEGRLYQKDPADRLTPSDLVDMFKKQ
tara:strand:- start:19208 stop:19873 length:666 start_codon:yes stop_codon:yes gene_type:complete